MITTINPGTKIITKFLTICLIRLLLESIITALSILLLNHYTKVTGVMQSNTQTLKLITGWQSRKRKQPPLIYDRWL